MSVSYSEYISAGEAKDMNCFHLFCNIRCV